MAFLLQFYTVPEYQSIEVWQLDRLGSDYFDFGSLFDLGSSQVKSGWVLDSPVSYSFFISGQIVGCPASDNFEVSDLGCF